jgi:hypothetical protein
MMNADMSREGDELIWSLVQTRALLEKHGDCHVSASLAKIGARLARGDWTVVAWAVTEATGSMGSLNDRILSVRNGDAIQADQEEIVNRRLRALVGEVERTARAAAAVHGVHLVR